ncbi:MAG: ATP-dependent chaperone ClpB, partial [Planctomycetota bacterium]
GSQTIMDLSGKEDDQIIQNRVMDALQHEFLPEFLNRIDEVIVFHPLGRDEIRQIVDLQLKHLSGLVEANGFSLEVSAAAKDQLAEEGYDPSYGARPLKRAIQQNIQNELANKLLSGAFTEGATIYVDAHEGLYLFSEK